MKNLYPYYTGLFLLLFFASCSKSKEKQNCLLVPALLILPNFNFQVVDKNSGNDLFFSSPPAYSLADIKIVFKKQDNKPDSITPQLSGAGSMATHFVYFVVSGRLTDTCYIKIKNLKTDTLVSTVEKKVNECGSNYFISKVQVNKNPAIPVLNTSVVVIKN